MDRGRDLNSLVFKTVVWYVLLSLLWIFASDWLLAELRPCLTAEHISILSSLKGAAFVLVTGLLLWVFLRRMIRQLRDSEFASRRAEKTYRDLFSANPVPALVVDKQSGVIQEANPAACSLYGYATDRLEGVPIEEIIPAVAPPGAIETTLAEETVCEHRSATGDQLFVRTRALSTIFQEQPAFLLLGYDETPWRLARKERRKTLRHLEAAQRVGQVGHWEYVPRRQKVFLSEGASRILGLPTVQDQWVGTTQLADLVQFEAYEKVSSLFLQSDHPRSFEHHLRVARGGHSKRDILVRGEYLEDEDGGHLWVGSCVDLTQRYQAEARLRERERQYRKLVDVLPDAVLVCQESTIIFANSAAAVIFGATSSKELENLSIIDLIQEDNEPWHPIASQQSHVRDGVHRISRLTFKTLDGATFTGQFAARPVELEGQPCVQILISDVTERERIKRALVEANQRLMKLANRSVIDLELERKVIAQALHDEIGQSLTAIRLSAGWLTKNTAQPKVLEKVTLITQIASDAIEKVRDLSLMLRPPQLEDLGLVAALRWQASRLLDEAEVTWSVAADDSVSRVKAPIDIIAFRVVQEAFTNIVRHAHASNVSVNLRCSRTHLFLEVKDNGVGFDADKETQRLGLAYMQERVQIAGGRIHIGASSEAGGTCIQVWLPLIQAEELA